MDATPTVNPILSQTAEEYYQGQDAFIARMVAPIFPSGEQSGNYYVNDIENLVSTPENLERAPGGKYVRATTRLSNDTFVTKDRGVEVPVDDSQRKKYRIAWDADRSAIEKGVRTILTDREIRVADLFTDSSVPAEAMTALDGTNGATFIAEVETEIEEIRKATGLRPNKLILPITEWTDHLKHDTYLLTRIKHTANNTEMTEITAAALANLLKLDEIIIPEGLKASTKDGQTVATTDIWTQGEGYLFYAPPAGSALEAPSSFRTFTWSEETTDMVVESYRDDLHRSDIHRVRSYDDVKLTGSALTRQLTGL